MSKTCNLVGSLNEMVLISTECQEMGVENSKKRKIARKRCKEVKNSRGRKFNSLPTFSY